MFLRHNSLERALSQISWHIVFAATLRDTNYLRFTNEDKALSEWPIPRHCVMFQSGPCADRDLELCLQPFHFLLGLVSTQDRAAPHPVGLLFPEAFLPGTFLFCATCWIPSISPTGGLYRLPWKLPTTTFHPSNPSALGGPAVPWFWGQRIRRTHEGSTS